MESCCNDEAIRLELDMGLKAFANKVLNPKELNTYNRL